MLIANLIVIVAILGCAAYMYFQGTLVKSAVMLVVAICALIPALAYYEALADMLISRGKLVEWAQPLCFGLLFIVAFALLQTAADQIQKTKIELPLLVDQIGRAVCGLFLGLIIAGIVLTAMAMAPLDGKFPYPRFSKANPTPDSPRNVLLSADSLATGLFGHVSSGSLSGKRSFAAVHPSLINELTLNRLNGPKDLFVKDNPISTPPKSGVWPAPENLRDTEGEPVTQRPGRTLMFVRAEIGSGALRDGLDLTQLRLICTAKGLTGDRLQGKGRDVYVSGYRAAPGQLKTVRPGDKLEGGGAGKKTFDLAFYVPDDLVPAAIAYKLNFLTGVSLPGATEPEPEAPRPEPAEETETAPADNGGR
jgi:hypothetical protein